ncbi:hypothetical protein [uncultured Mobiluncus sp.]|uniref:hypothetical protein n=1 Tax=uncultured Mobiluncus sp. TaxID=293425 RepID=UPI002631842E|nr:hypothetical protein [uncultured Mobiluncus sp.]
MMATHMDWLNVTFPPLAEWQGVASWAATVEGYIIVEPVETGGILIDLAPLRPGVVNRLKATLDVTAKEGETPAISFAEKHEAIPEGGAVIILESTLPVDPILTITGAARVKVIGFELQIRFPDRSKPYPYDLIGFDMLTPTVRPGFIIGKSHIGAAPLGGFALTSGGFTIGESRLDVDFLEVPTPEYVWKDILGPGLSLAFRQGANGGSSLLPVAQVGTAEIKIKDFDPRLANLRRGLKARIYDRLTRQILFTGTLESFSLEPAKTEGEHDIATLEFVDAVGILSAKKRYGVRLDAPESFNARIARLLDGQGVDYQIEDIAPALDISLGPCVTEATLTEYLDMTCATVGAAWWVDHKGKVIFNPNNEVEIFHQIPWFIIGKTPLDGGKLAPDGAQHFQDTTNEPPAQVENPFIIGQTPLDAGNIGAAAADPATDKQFIIGQSRLDYALISNFTTQTGFALPEIQGPPLFTDRYSTDPRAMYYVDLEPGFDSAEILNEVAVENHTATRDENGWSDHTKTFTATNKDIAAAYGTSRKTVKAFASSDTGAQRLADYYLARPLMAGESALQVSSVRFDAMTYHQRLTRLDLFDYCQLVFREKQTNHLVYATQNQLTPFTWFQRLYLTEAKERITAHE